MGADRKFRLAAVGDLHCREDQQERIKELVREVNGEADGLVLCGDLTDRGLPDETKALAEALAGLRVPCAAVLGNHDWEAGSVKELAKVLHDVGVHVLDGDHIALSEEVGVAGVKGFGGGFGASMLQPFGEGAIKAFVQEGVSEALKLEVALGQLDTPKRVVLTHYAPIAETTEGESAEIRPYLGTSRLATAIDLYGADVALHGHAHHGSHEGRTAKGVPVYNVAMPLLRRSVGKHFLLLEL